MRAGSAAFLMILVAIISAGATYILTQDSGSENDSRIMALNTRIAAQSTQISNLGGQQSGFATIVIPVTATPDPNVILITVTPQGQVLPEQTEASSSEGQGGAEALGVTLEPTAGSEVEADTFNTQGPEAAYGEGRPTTVDPEFFGFGGSFDGTQEDLPQGCLLHNIADGEFPTLIISNYDLPPQTTFVMMAMNGLTEETATNLQIGDPLVIPFDGCPVEQFLEIQGTVVTELTPVTEDDTEEVVAAQNSSETSGVAGTPESTEPARPTAIPIPTLAPTVVGSFVEIINIISPGDLALEGVEIVNNGVTTDVSGWTLSDADGNVFTFPDQRRLFSGASLTINTRAGTNTAVVMYWGQDAPLFETDDVVVLKDADGNVMSSVRIP